MIKRDEKKEAKKFAVVLGIGGALLGGILAWKARPIGAYVSFGIGGAALLVGYAMPSLWLAFFRKWMKLAEALSWVMTRVILSTFFFLLLTPTALALRLLGRTPLDLRFRDGKPSYWIEKPEGEYTVERYRKLY